MLHYKACARTRKEKAGDIALIIFGVLAAVYTTAQTLKVGVIPLDAFFRPLIVLHIIADVRT